jgi:hypothetical protein
MAVAAGGDWAGYPCRRLGQPLVIGPKRLPRQSFRKSLPDLSIFCCAPVGVPHTLSTFVIISDQPVLPSDRWVDEGRVTREVPIVKFNSNAAVGIAVSPMGGTAEPATVVRVRQGIVAVTGDLPTRRVGAWQLT